MKNKRQKGEGVTMLRGKCMVLSDDDETFRLQLRRLSANDRKAVADFRRLLHKIHSVRARNKYAAKVPAEKERKK